MHSVRGVDFVVSRAQHVLKPETEVAFALIDWAARQCLLSWKTNMN